MSLLVLTLLLWIPGMLLHRGFGVARGPWGCGRFAVEATLSLAFLSVVLMPLYLVGASMWMLPVTTAAATAALALAAGRLHGRPTTRRSDERGADWKDDASTLEIAVFTAAIALLLPVTLAHCGANVDDWWDLSFVRGWLADGRVGFSQMALSADPDTHRSPVHPRFLWSVWLMLQALVAYVTGEQAWRVQAGALATVTVVLVVSAQAALARALFRRSTLHGATLHGAMLHGATGSTLLAIATIATTAAWIWGTEALPLFVRGYQDKLFAAFVLAPVLLAFVLQAAEPSDDGVEETAASYAQRRRLDALAVAAAALATVSVHSLVYTMAASTCAVALLALHGRGVLAWLRGHVGIAVALPIAALYPIGQALALATIFGDQGISLATRDNPVVRAHLSLNRLVGAVGPTWVVHPGAVFGAVALPALIAIWIAWRRRHVDAGARVLVAISIVPCVLLFVPGIAGLAGKLWVPWMLYRLGWMVPVAPLLAYGLVRIADSGSATGSRRWVAVAFAALVIALSGSTATDRLRRAMDEHPGQPDGAPIAAAAAVYDFLDAQKGRDAVLAPPNFSELVPALTGKPVVAFPERGTLVFATDEVRAYERLRDRATFYAATSSAAERDEVAVRYGVRWAVLPRRQVASGSEQWWLWRFGPEALLAARGVDVAQGGDGTPCGDSALPGRTEEQASLRNAIDGGVASRSLGPCRGWWSESDASVAAHLSPAWSIVLDTRDYFVVEHRAEGASATSIVSTVSAASATHASREANASAVAVAHERATAEGSAAAVEQPRWLRPFSLTPPNGSATPPSSDRVLATATDTPGSFLSFALPPRYILPSVLPVWADGPAAWEDAPADATITLDIGVACRVSAVEVVPHLPRERREVLELRVDDSVDDGVVRSAAVHGRGILVPVDAATTRRSVTLRAASLIGNPVSLADVRLIGDPSTCDGKWPVHRKPRAPQLAAGNDALLALVAGQPPGGRALVSLARHAARDRGRQASVDLLLEATRRQPSLVEAWIDLGFAQDDLAAAASSPEQAEAARAAALAAFQGAVTADSNSAWARGCAAWAERRAGHPLVAMYDALAAAQLDPMYADAWTVVGYALGDLGLHALAERALDRAEGVDPVRNWPALARADLAMARGDFEAAREAMRSWLRKHPFDEAARAKISEIAAASASNAEAPSSEGSVSSEASAQRDRAPAAAAVSPRDQDADR